MTDPRGQTIRVALRDSVRPVTHEVFAALDSLLHELDAAREKQTITDRPHALELIEREYATAAQRYERFNSPHEGWAVIKEELDELWAEVKANRGDQLAAAGEAVQVAAMCVRYLVDLCHAEEEHVGPVHHVGAPASEEVWVCGNCVFYAGLYQTAVGFHVHDCVNDGCSGLLVGEGHWCDLRRRGHYFDRCRPGLSLRPREERAERSTL